MGPPAAAALGGAASPTPNPQHAITSIRRIAVLLVWTRSSSLIRALTARRFPTGRLGAATGTIRSRRRPPPADRESADDASRRGGPVRGRRSAARVVPVAAA